MEINMAEIKNFGLAGVSNDLQLGKTGPRLIVNGTAVEAHGSDGVALINLRVANAIVDNDVVNLSQLNSQVAILSDDISNATVTDGYELVLGNSVSNGDGAWSNGAVPLTDTSKVSHAVDALNVLLAKLVPTSPPNFPNGVALAVGSAGTSPALANGAANPASAAISAGTAVTRITGGTVSSTNTWTAVGPGNSGTLSLLINNSAVASVILTGSGQAGNHSGLNITGQNDYPVSTPGFWKAINATVTGATVSVGVNSMEVTDTATGNSNMVFFVDDNVTATPVISAVSVAQATATYGYSSSVPHYSTATLTVGASISNLAGQTYNSAGPPLSIGATNSLLSTQTYSYATTGIATPIAANTTVATAMSNVTVSVNGTNVHNQGVLSLAGTNVNGQGSATNPSTILLVKNGSAGARIDETSITVTGLGTSPNGNNANRVSMAGGDTPSDTATTWVQTAALQTYDATVVAGVLKNDKTNYSTGYLPVGPNLSGQDSAQYVTFAFERTALSQFNIVVTGTYAGCWVALPGVSDNAGTSPDALGGAWWNGFAAYNGAGVPGRTGDAAAGCASGTNMTGGSGTFGITFGTASSTSATSNTILVRFRLNTGQSITALSFTN
jgi:hypothetical protein